MKIEGTIRTFHTEADSIAESVSADNLSEMKTEAHEGFVITRIESSRIRSVIASMDDYMTNITVAEELCEKLQQARTVKKV